MKHALLICIALVALAGAFGVLGFATESMRLVSQLALFGSPAAANAATGLFWEDAALAVMTLLFAGAQIYLALWAFKRRRQEAS